MWNKQQSDTSPAPQTFFGNFLNQFMVVVAHSVKWVKNLSSGNGCRPAINLFFSANSPLHLKARKAPVTNRFLLSFTFVCILIIFVTKIFEVSRRRSVLNHGIIHSLLLTHLVCQILIISKMRNWCVTTDLHFCQFF